MNLKSLFKKPIYSIDSVELSTSIPHTLKVNLIKTSGNPFSKNKLTQYFDNITAFYTEKNEPVYEDLILNPNLITYKLSNSRTIVIANIKHFCCYYLFILEGRDNNTFINKKKKMIGTGKVIGNILRNLDDINSFYLPVYEEIIKNEKVYYKVYLDKLSFSLDNINKEVTTTPSITNKSVIIVDSEEPILNNLNYGNTLNTNYLIFTGNLSLKIITDKHNPSFELLKSILSKVILFDFELIESNENRFKFKTRLRGKFVNDSLSGRTYSNLRLELSDSPYIYFTLTTDTITITLDDNPENLIFYNKFNLLKESLVELSLKYENLFYKGLVTHGFNLGTIFGEFIFIDNAKLFEKTDVALVSNYILTKIESGKTYAHLDKILNYCNTNDSKDGKFIKQLLTFAISWYKQPTIITNDVSILGKLRSVGYKNTYLMTNHEKLN